MKISHEEFQKARRISKAIQEHLEQINDDGLRSTDLYPILARKKLIEKDKNNGSQFRKFLRQLKEKNALNLIPQCKFQHSSRNPKHFEWHFYRTTNNIVENETNNETKNIITPKLPEDEINVLIEKAQEYVEGFPKKDDTKLTLPQIETRKLYERAYENWSNNEIRLMNRAFEAFGRIDKVAELLKRQPSVVRKKIEME
ncbi:hypothetical protein FEZ18_05145 [Oceanihabitans sp. IOP_32]|uniref:hypothetical protein n=1 Tax=Oceanihabitans sp. IOP_32 TaxID=2529032 RepID=UPI0012934FC5|nr:hypothetical protein [Oceanihabitans sp. IOP_32]QFZ54226.1 hypothetical protein FEZ18_05145 [Oceanihabitans sp. IOP_32]